MRKHNAFNRALCALLGFAGLAVACGPSEPPGEPLRHREPLLVTIHESQLVVKNGKMGDTLGSAVALSGDVALIGAAHGWGDDLGAAHVFTRSEGMWALAQELTPSTPVAHFGSSAALDGNTALIGAPTHGGSVFVFTAEGGSWSEQQTLTASTSAAPQVFGSAVALSGNTALVGDFAHDGINGQVYVFTRGDAGFTQQEVLETGERYEAFGYSLALDGGTAWIGAPYLLDENIVEPQSGAVYVYERIAGKFEQVQRLQASAPAKGDRFGEVVALSGNRAIVGAPHRMKDASPGAVYFFERVGENWKEVKRVQASDGYDGDAFGSSVALFGERALVGGELRVGGPVVDWAYLLVKDGEEYIERKLKLPGTRSQDKIRLSLALKEHTAVIASPLDDVDGLTRHGSVNILELGGFRGDPCEHDAECVSNHCIEGSCRESCTRDETCPAEAYCASEGYCAARKELGARCDAAGGADCFRENCRVCVASTCVDGVCCESACDGVCEACSASRSGGKDGECAPIPAGEDPDEECATDPKYPDSCGADGTCDGERHCRRYALRAVSCGETHCSDGKLVGPVCDGNGNCKDDEVSCGLYACTSKGCTGPCKLNADCVSEARCRNGECVPKGALGDSCEDGAECASNHCVDGVCCEGSCDGQCEACNAKGDCVPWRGAPRGERAPCEGGTGACAAVCDGEEAHRTSCTFPGPTEACGKRCDDKGGLLELRCDGAGTCQPGTSTTCGAYACEGSACLSACTAKADCAAGYHCEAPACVPETGMCPETACDPGFVCNPTTKRCEPLPTKLEDDGGCACRAAPPRGSSRGVWLLAWISAMLLAERRHRPRTRECRAARPLQPR